MTKLKKKKKDDQAGGQRLMQVFGLPTLTCNSQMLTELTFIHTQKKPQTNKNTCSSSISPPQPHHQPTFSGQNCHLPSKQDAKDSRKRRHWIWTQRNPVYASPLLGLLLQPLPQWPPEGSTDTHGPALRDQVWEHQLQASSGRQEDNRRSSEDVWRADFHLCLMEAARLQSATAQSTETTIYILQYYPQTERATKTSSRILRIHPAGVNH